MKIWKLKSGSDKRFRAGHPWVYSNELAESPKGIEPGAMVELQDSNGKFLARGYGNPASLISFRSLTRDPSEVDPLSVDTLLKRLSQAADVRKKLGLHPYSYRLCFAEADRLPGLIIDRYVLNGASDGKPSQAFVIQAHTAGMDRVIPNLTQALQQLCQSLGGIAWDRTALVIRNDVGVRRLEGLVEEPPKVLKEIPGLNLANVKVWIRSASALAGAQEDGVLFHTDLIEGQKTGFFLDQSSNVQAAIQRLGALVPEKKIRILDLCCYVGQWSTQLARFYKKAGYEVEVTIVDASATALAFELGSYVVVVT